MMAKRLCWLGFFIWYFLSAAEKGLNPPRADPPMKFDPLVPPAEVRVEMSREPGAVFVGDLLAGGP